MTPSKKNRRRVGGRFEEPRGIAAVELRARRMAVPNQPSDDAGLRDRFIEALKKKEAPAEGVDAIAEGEGEG